MNNMINHCFSNNHSSDNNINKINNIFKLFEDALGWWSLLVGFVSDFLSGFVFNNFP